MLARLRLLPLCLLLLLPLATGCGDSGGGEIQVPPLSQGEADDVAQLAGIATGMDHGGWLAMLESTQQGMPAAPQRFTGHYGGGAFTAVKDPRVGAFRDTGFTRAGVVYNIRYLYADTAGTDSLATWNPDVREMEIISTGLGTIQTASDSSGFTHQGNGHGFGLFEAITDTLNLVGTTSDSTLTKMFRVYNTSELRYFNVTYSTDYDLDWNRQNNPGYPFNGSASISVLADRLNSFNPSDVTTDLPVDAVITIVFDGTQTPLINVTNNPDNPTPQFRYRMNLRTGVVTRFP